MFPPKLSECPLNVGLPASNIRCRIGGRHVLEYATTHRPRDAQLGRECSDTRGLHGQHREAVFSANWFTRHALSNITLPLAISRVNTETRK